MESRDGLRLELSESSVAYEAQASETMDFGSIAHTFSGPGFVAAVPCDAATSRHRLNTVTENNEAVECMVKS